MQIKTTMWYHLILVRMVIIKKSTNNQCWRRCGEEKGTFLHCYGNVMVQLLWGRVWRFLKKLKIELYSYAFWPSVGLWRNVCLDLLLIFDWAVCFSNWPEGTVCKFLRLIPFLSHLQMYSPFLFMVSFAVQELLSLIRSCLFSLFLFFIFLFITLGVDQKKRYSCDLCQRLFWLYFPLKSLITSGLIFRSLIHFEFIFVYGVNEYSNFILLGCSNRMPQVSF